MDAIGSARAGMQASMARFNAGAAALVRSQATSGAAAPSANPAGQALPASPVSNPVDAQIDMLVARTDFRANLAVLKTAKGLHDATLQLWG